MSNFAEEHAASQRLDILTKAWTIEKAAEDSHHNAKLAIEQEIRDLAKIDPSISGTKVLPNSVRVTCKPNRKWDQDYPSRYWHKIQELPISDRPFTIVYKENKKNMDALQLFDKDLYDVLQPGLTEEPAKPAFKLYKPKEKKRGK